MKTLRLYFLIGSLIFAADGLFNVSAQQTENKTGEKNAAPHSGDVSVSGKVLNSVGGRGVANALITVTVGNRVIYAKTNPFGFYKIPGITAGSTCVFQIRHKRYNFSPQVISVVEDLSDVNFIARSVE